MDTACADGSHLFFKENQVSFCKFFFPLAKLIKLGSFECRLFSILSLSD